MQKFLKYPACYNQKYHLVKNGDFNIPKKPLQPLHRYGSKKKNSNEIFKEKAYEGVKKESI